jgi:hypothetical protein
MLGKCLLLRREGVLVCALLLAACQAYDPKLLRYENPGGAPPPDSGMPAPENDASSAEDDGGKPCVKADEICNGRDDDCDGKTDEDTQAYCESIILHAVTTCVSSAFLCVKIRCVDGFADCDGKPQNGCEKRFCECNDCSDAGSEADGGH